MISRRHAAVALPLLLLPAPLMSAPQARDTLGELFGEAWRLRNLEGLPKDLRDPSRPVVRQTEDALYRALRRTNPRRELAR